MIELYAGEMSIFPAKVRIVLAEKGLAFEPRWVPWSETGGYAFPEIVGRVNPFTELPVLVHDGLEIYDSTIVCEYLEDQFPDPPLYPTTPQEKAVCRQLENEGDLYIFGSVARFYPDEHEPEPMRLAQLELNDAFRRLDRLLENKDYLCGPFTVADIATYLPISYGETMGVEVDASLENLAAWRRRMSERRAVKDVLTSVAKSAAAHGL